MAVTLSVTLTDAEQAKLLAMAEVIAPGMTPLQVKAWAEKNAKAGLRSIVQQLWNQRVSEDLETAWPVIPPASENPE